MSKVADHHKAHGHHARPHHGHKPGNHNPAPTPGPITNFQQQALDQQMMIFQMQQAQLIQRLNAQIAGLQSQLQGPQLTPQQQAAQAQAEQQAAAQQAAQQAAFAAYETQALSQFQATSAAMQQQFAGAMQGFGSLETSLGGFLNQSFAPAQYSGGVVSLTASSALFSGPIAIPSFYGGRRY
ncbi:hypothetical protein JST97_26350 [bacterium]|nr:hypothetical protein [bacterium]